MASKTQRFRELIEADESRIQPGIYDGFGARLVQQMGFGSAAIKEVEQRCLTTAQREAKCGVAR